MSWHRQCDSGLDPRQHPHYSAQQREDYSYDVSWWNDKQQVVLAVEIEWYGIKYPLETLFAAQCPIKLLISGTKDLSSTRDLLERSLRRYRRHIVGEHYVWLAVEGAEANGQIQAFECKIAGSGHSPYLTFQAIEQSDAHRFFMPTTLAA